MIAFGYWGKRRVTTHSDFLEVMAECDRRSVGETTEPQQVTDATI